MRQCKTYLCAGCQKWCPRLALLQNTVAVCHCDTIWMSNSRTDWHFDILWLWPMIMDLLPRICWPLAPVTVNITDIYTQWDSPWFDPRTNFPCVTINDSYYHAQTEIALLMYIRHNYARVANCIRCILSRWVAFNFNNRRNIQCWLLI
jgi:hypothetical protein